LQTIRKWADANRTTYSLLLFVKNLIHSHTHTYTDAHKFKKCNIPLTEMTIYWWFLLIAIYFNSARKCIADVTPRTVPYSELHPSHTVCSYQLPWPLPLPRLAKVDAANKQSVRQTDWTVGQTGQANMYDSVNIKIK